jgi:hypothetical protein
MNRDIDFIQVDNDWFEIDRSKQSSVINFCGPIISMMSDQNRTDLQEMVRIGNGTIKIHMDNMNDIMFFCSEMNFSVTLFEQPS